MSLYELPTVTSSSSTTIIPPPLGGQSETHCSSFCKVKTHTSSRYYYQHSPYNSGTDTQAPPMPLQLWLFLFLVLISIGLSWYVSYESAFESLVDQLRLTIMVLPLVLLLAVHWLSSSGRDKRWVPFLIQFPERESFHRAGGSPWGIGLLLLVLVFLISHQPYFHERWFPLLSR